jgi:hypothetical protein
MEAVMAHLPTRQVKQLIEIDNAGEGIRDEVQLLIQRLTLGGVSFKFEDPCVAQAKILWVKGFGMEHNCENFGEYLDGIPPISEGLKASSPTYTSLTLVDSRINIQRQCHMLGVKFAGGSDAFDDFDPGQARKEWVYWMRAANDRIREGRTVSDLRKGFSQKDLFLTVKEGLALLAQRPALFEGNTTLLPGSVNCECRDYIACIRWTKREPELIRLRGEPVQGSKYVYAYRRA